MSQFSSSPSEIHLYSGALMGSWLMAMTKASPKWCSSPAVAGTEWGPSWWVTPAGWPPVHKTHLLLDSMWTTVPTSILLTFATRSLTCQTNFPSCSASICLMSTTAQTHRGPYAVLSLCPSETSQQGRNYSPTTSPLCVRVRVHLLYTVLLWYWKWRKHLYFKMLSLPGEKKHLLKYFSLYSQRYTWIHAKHVYIDFYNLQEIKLLLFNSWKVFLLLKGIARKYWKTHRISSCAE